MKEITGKRGRGNDAADPMKRGPQTEMVKYQQFLVDQSIGIGAGQHG
jgi:hypothetical protein